MANVIPFRNTKAILEPMVIRIIGQQLYWSQILDGHWVKSPTMATWYHSPIDLPKTMPFTAVDGYPPWTLIRHWRRREKQWVYSPSDSDGIVAVVTPADESKLFHNFSGYPGWNACNDPVYEMVEEKEDRIVIRDIGHKTGMSVTNGVVLVVEELRDFGHLPKGRRLFYYDNEEQLNEIVVESGKFVRFKVGLKQSNE